VVGLLHTLRKTSGLPKLKQQEAFMALEQRIEALRKRHAELDLRILAENSRPMPDQNALHQMKIQKLLTKDDINRLISGQREAA